MFLAGPREFALEDLEAMLGEDGSEPLEASVLGALSQVGRGDHATGGL